jgi:enoyl-CoA hydratase/carnithine racemase
MEFVKTEVQNGIATLTLQRGKVNALNGSVIKEISTALQNFENDSEVTAVILTGKDKFFSFGFDIPEFLAYSKTDFTEFLVNFTNLYSYLFLYPKPVVAALNGHTIAGGCMLALACDVRLMVSGKGKISLNEIGFGSSVFAGATEILLFWVGGKNGTDILYSGKMYDADEAKRMNLIDSVVSEEQLITESIQAARTLGDKYLPAFKSVKKFLREPIADSYRPREMESITEFVENWYSESTWENLKKIQIR